MDEIFLKTESNCKTEFALIFRSNLECVTTPRVSLQRAAESLISILGNLKKFQEIDKIFQKLSKFLCDAKIDLCRKMFPKGDSKFSQF